LLGWLRVLGVLGSAQHAKLQHWQSQFQKSKQDTKSTYSPFQRDWIPNICFSIVAPVYSLKDYTISLEIPKQNPKVLAPGMKSLLRTFGANFALHPKRLAAAIRLLVSRRDSRDANFKVRIHSLLKY